MKAKKFIHNTPIWVLGIDPGNTGSFVLTNGVKLKTWEMPLIQSGKNKTISHRGVMEILSDVVIEDDVIDGPEVQVYLERAMPMAMGSKHAFSYGRGFEAIVIAIETIKLPMTMVEPQKWAKEMHEGISADLKPKAKSLIAAKRLFPKLVAMLPTKPKGGVHDGMIDALLIAGYGLRKQGGQLEDPNDVGSFL